MKSFARLLLCSFLSGLSGAVASLAATPPAPPNVVVILSDDYGYGSLGAYGADPALVRTPHLDRLAREGRRFTNAYTPSSVCTPTRYAFLTGRYCWRTSLNHGGVANTLDPLLIETSRPTIASLLKQHGYSTGFVGKWHLGYGTAPRVDYTNELKPGPLELGFDYQFAVPQNHNDITRVFVENHGVFGLRSAKLTSVPGKLGLDAPERDDPKTMGDLTARAVSWLEKQAGRPAPFFLYFAPVAVHELVTPSAETQGTSKAGPYGDFIHDLDRSVGRIIAALEKQHALENTLIIFTSDNGGVISGGQTGASKTAMDAGLKINGALRGGKHDIWEGGFKVPFLVRWPGRVPAGTTSSEMIGVVDIFATVAAIVGETKLDRTTTAPDSVNVLAAFLGEPGAQPLRRDLILQSASGVYAIRSGPWKWIDGVPIAPKGKKAPAATGPKAEQFRPRLVNLSEDPAETTDVSAAHPDVVKRLAETLRTQRAQGFSRE
ncbi:sulfatase family protein [Horticoccus sp. 23ND18S-11]|uniref:sulfatase family protein n=1 Tax=Horticoccus sp. 23ND18S-11 TaxID=3391832 RepID=UPI0039C989E3